MAKVCGPFHVENAENSAVAVQLYKTACDLVRILDRVTKSAASMKDLHQPKVISYRLRLRETCERLMFVDPMRHGKKAEDFLWKKVHYEVISLAKKLHKSPGWSRGDLFWLQNHIRMGLGTYHHLIFRLQSEYVYLGGDIFTDFILPLAFRGSVGQSVSAKCTGINNDRSNDQNYEWALQAYQRCLICMGDLARYNLEYFGGRPIIASRYYHQALLVCSESNMPFNQLGTLVATNNYGFDSVYFYMRCTLYNNGFDGAKANLNRAFDRNRHWLESAQQEQRDNKPNKMFQVRLFLCKLIKYAEFVYKAPAEELGVSIGELCENVIVEFQRCLEMKVVERRLKDDCCSPQAPCHLTDDVILKMFVMAVMCVEKFERHDTSNTLAATAFILASFSHLLNHILICLELSGISVGIEEPLEEAAIIPNEEPSVDLINFSSSEISANNEVHLNKSIENENHVKVRRPKKPKAVRPRKKGGFDDSDLSEGGESSNGDESEDENRNESEDTDSSVGNEDENYDEDDDKDSIHSRSGSSANSDTREGMDREITSHIPNGLEILNSAKDNFEFRNEEATNELHSSFSCNPLELLQSIEQLLITVKVCCNWLEAHPEIISASAQGSQKLWTRFVTFINLLVQIESKMESCSEFLSCDPVIIKKAQEWNKDNWNQEYPLPEDLALRDLKMLSKGRVLNYNILSTSWLSEIDQMLLRTASLRRFAYVLTKSTELGIQYLDKSGEFIYTHFERQSVDVASIDQLKGETKEQKQNLMQNMAQLWLEAEVKELESSVQLLDRPRFSPYLIPDISVLLTHLDFIAQLMASKIFIFILPIVALQHLDEKKKESSKARKAIRWLETEFQKHNRYLRAQKRHERVTLPLLKYPKRRDKEAWNVFSVLECAKYFSRYGNNDKSSSSCLATILVTSSKMATSPADDSKSNGYTNTALLPLAQSSDLKVENVVEFYNKWKSSNNSKAGSGKKSSNQNKEKG